MTHESREELPLSKAAETLLEECRILLPGLQALFGFQLIVVFNPGFGEKLSAPEQQLHLFALALVAVAGAVIMTPAAYHRQTCPREVTAGFIKLSTRLIMASMPLLALGISADFYLITRIILGSVAGALATAAVFLVFVVLWFVLPRVRALRDVLEEGASNPGAEQEQGKPESHRNVGEGSVAIPLDQLPAWEPDSGRLQVVVDTPRGSRNKYKYDPESGVWRLAKALPLGAAFPFDFGFIPSTKGGDGDPVDALVIMDEPAMPGCVVSARLIGVIEAEQTENGKTIRNDRLVAVLDTPRNPAAVGSLEELGRQRLDEIEHFFVAYNEAEGRRFKPLARRGPEKARELVAASLINHPPTRRNKPRKARKRAGK
jgi:inorganic pyrophosphatase